MHVRSRPWVVSGGVKGVDEIFLGLLEVNCYPTVVMCARGDANFEAGPAVTTQHVTAS